MVSKSRQKQKMYQVPSSIEGQQILNVEIGVDREEVKERNQWKSKTSSNKEEIVYVACKNCGGWKFIVKGGGV